LLKFDIRKWLSEPLVHFLFIGGLLFVVYAYHNDSTDIGNRILISTGELQSLKAQWTKRRNRAPGDEEMKNLLDQVIRDRILASEAKALGLDRHDSVVERRLAQKMEFLFSDLVDITEPDEQALQRYLEENMQQYQEPDRVSFSQIYSNPDQRQDELSDAANLLAKLPAELSGVDLSELGDRFLLPSSYQMNSRRDVERNFGTTFANQLFENTGQGWHGPLVSGFGVHLVFVESVVSAPPPRLQDIRGKLVYDWLEVKGKEQNRNFYQALRKKYTVVIGEGN
jgi:parvulin-like peptidyl-prolyl isomerase